VGIGASLAKIMRVYPAALVDRATGASFGFTRVRVPKNRGGRLEFAVDVKTKRVTLIGIPRIPTCE